MVFVVIMIREINSKDEQGNDNIITNSLHYTAITTSTTATETSQHSQTMYVSRPLAVAAAAAAEQFSDTRGVIVQVMVMTL